MFSQKLDTLMNIAGVSNSRLGQSIGMNSSHIGRLRNGKRPLPQKHEWLPGVCKYIEKHITKPYQMDLLFKTTGIKINGAENSRDFSQQLEKWLLSEDVKEQAAEKFLYGFTNISSGEIKKLPSNGSFDEGQSYSPFLFGNEGKRQAVIQFFNLILKEDKPQTLLLFSDENMSWLYEDPSFSKKWIVLFTKVLMKGNKVKIIHNISRDLNELLEAVSKWVPIYMTGKIEPFVYPRLKDGLFKRTLFIAPSTAAVMSSSVHDETDEMLNLFITDRDAVSALIKEYERYLSLCRPLMQIFTSQNKNDFASALNEFIDNDGDSFVRSSVLPLFAMPEETAKKIEDESGIPVRELRKHSLERFCRHVEKNKLYITLPEEKLKADNKGFYSPSIELAVLSNISYTESDYLLHLQNLKELNKKYKNLHLTYSPDIPEHTHLLVKDDFGVIMIKTNEPIAAFLTKEPNMTNAFWDYAKMKYEKDLRK